MSLADRCICCTIVFLACLGTRPSTAQTVAPSHWASSALEILGIAESRADSQRVAGKNATGIAGTSAAPFRALGSDYTRYQLAAVFGDMPVYRKTANVTQSRLIGVERTFQSYGLEGDGIRIGLWDIGHPYPHVEFGRRLEQASDGEESSLSGHATHVAGTLIAAGIESEARGVAPLSTVVAYGSDGDYLEMYAASGNGLRVSNHSYAFAAGWERTSAGAPVDWTYFGSAGRIAVYNTITWFWDWTAEDNPYYLIVNAAGNDAGQGPAGGAAPHFHNGFSGETYADVHPEDCSAGSGCLGALAMARNALVVGSLDPTGATVSSFSSRGPTIDGRLKPDVMAVGEGVYSTVAGDGYAVSSGTSMAAPMVTGAVALLLDGERRLYGQPHLLSSTVKALLVNTADDLGAQGPDYAYGWGRVNTEAAVSLLDDDHAAGGTSILQPKVEGVFEVVVPVNGAALRATLAWIDPRGDDPTTRDDPTSPILVHDFDLEISIDDHQYLPWVLDPSDPAAPAAYGRDHLNNVEQVDVPVTAQGYATVRVTSPPGVSQQVSLVISTGDRSVSTGSEQFDFESAAPEFRPGIDVYPNPVAAGAVLHLDTSATVERIELIDMIGRRVAIRTGPDSAFETPSGLAPGVYILRVDMAGGPVSKRLVVRR